LWKIRNGWILVIDCHIVEGFPALNNDEREEKNDSRRIPLILIRSAVLDPLYIGLTRTIMENTNSPCRKR